MIFAGRVGNAWVIQEAGRIDFSPNPPERSFGIIGENAVWVTDGFGGWTILFRESSQADHFAREAFGPDAPWCVAQFTGEEARVVAERIKYVHP